MKGKDTEPYGTINAGKYQVQYNGYVYEESGNKFLLVQVFQFDGDKPVNEGKPIRTLYCAPECIETIDKWLAREEDVEKLLESNNDYSKVK